MHRLTKFDSTSAASAAMPNLVPLLKREALRNIKNDFIRHPSAVPLQYRRLMDWLGFVRDRDPQTSDLGLTFKSDRQFPVGARLEIGVPLRGVVQKLKGTVVLVIERPDGFEVGLWLANASEAARARLVEEICYLECALQRKNHRVANADPRRLSPPQVPSISH